MEYKLDMQKELEEKGYTSPIFLGQGAMSQVWRLWDTQEKCFVACKISANDRRAEREAEMLKGLQHPVFPKYRQAWKGENAHFLLMEYIPGSSIAKMLERRGYFSRKQAVHITMELAEGLLYLHERSVPILFRDIKPDNVMLRSDGRVKLIDVGCAYKEGDELTIAGNRRYGAPEQFAENGKIGVESDVYALGKLLKAMLGVEDNKVGKRIPCGLRRLIAEATCEERQERIPDMRSFQQQLSVYEGNHRLKEVITNFNAWIRLGRKNDFYYVQNVRKGMDI